MATNDTSLPAAERTKLLNESLDALVLARDAYNTDDARPPAGWEFVDSTTNKPELNVRGFFARVYRRRAGEVPPGGAKYAVAFRGTDSIDDLKDLFTDVDIALEKLPGQYRQGLAFVQRVCQENNISFSEMEFAGHSLGGYLAVATGAALGAGKIWTFNSPGPTEKIEDKLDKQIPGISKPPRNNLVQVRSTKDLVSEWQYDQGIIISVKTGGNDHSLDSLKQGIVDDIKHQPIKPVKDSNALTHVFNNVAGFLAQSRLVRKIFGVLQDNDRHRTPKPPCV